MERLQIDHSDWLTFTDEDLEFLANLKVFLDEEERKKAAELAFHKSVWDAALDATGDPIFGCVSEEK